MAVEGPGTITCLQGVLTADVVSPGGDRVGYGAMLTAKGMIVVDPWWLRVGDRMLLVADSTSREVMVSSLKRQLPPRLARATDLSDSYSTLSIVGARDAGPLPSSLGVALEPGFATTATFADAPIWIARLPEWSPVSTLVAGPTEVVTRLGELAWGSAAHAGDETDLRVARVEAGVPTLGAEIDDKTLPQEAGYDGLGAVSYQKGCYVGQETVARVHFRGHPNWLLRRIEGPAGTTLPESGEVERDGRPAIRAGTVVMLDDGSLIGLAKVRREVEPGTTIPALSGTVTVQLTATESATNDGGLQPSPTEPPSPRR